MKSVKKAAKPSKKKQPAVAPSADNALAIGQVLITPAENGWVVAKCEDGVNGPFVTRTVIQRLHELPHGEHPADEANLLWQVLDALDITHSDHRPCLVFGRTLVEGEADAVPDIDERLWGQGLQLLADVDKPIPDAVPERGLTPIMVNQPPIREQRGPECAMASRQIGRHCG